MSKDSGFLADNGVHEKLNRYFLNGEDLKRHLLRQFGTYKRASFVVGWDESRVHQIASGYKVPSNPSLIKRLSEAWHIDIVILTALFEKLRRGGQ